jgi:DNA mismatch repair protein MLH3
LEFVWLMYLFLTSCVPKCSEEELLCTNPSSAMSLLMSGFGIEDSSSLHELNISDSVLKLSGYISGPCSSFFIKVQFIFI